MNKLIVASILTLAIASPALAESPAAWPREPVAGADNNGGVQHVVERLRRAGVTIAPPAPLNVWTADSASFSDWRALPSAADAGGQHATPAAELDAQQRQYRAYWLARNRELVTEDGALAPVLPVRVHERLNAKAFGSPVMGGAQ